MNSAPVDRIADAILYEGYVLYPYRPSSVKNRQRWNFGGLSPRTYSEAQRGAERWLSQTECIVTGSEETEIQVKARFLQLVARQAAEPNNHQIQGPCAATDFRPVEVLKIDGRLFQTWQEAVEREFSTPSLSLADLAAPQRCTFSFPSAESIELLRTGRGAIAGAFIRRQNTLEAAVGLSVERLADSLVRLRVQLLNLTPFTHAASVTRDQAMMSALVSSHLILTVQNGEFVSLLDPPAEFQDAAGQCQNVGCYPVLAGNDGERTTMLSSPVILYDYPQIAPESAGNLFDGTEIDEILALRIMTLTDEEKDEMRNSDERTRALLDRVESNPEHLANLHGTMRSTSEPEAEFMGSWNPLEEKPSIRSVRVPGGEASAGDRVILRPNSGGDIMDLALSGRVAMIESIEQDFEDRVHLAVIVDDDPGRDLGVLRQPGHRFFFSPEEVELVASGPK